MSSTQRVARLINTTGGNVHQGWESVAPLLDGDTFRWIFSGAGTSFLLGLGRGLGPGAFFQYTSYFKLAVERVSGTQIKLWESGVSTTYNVDSGGGDWWCLQRMGNTIDVIHLNDVVASWTESTDLKLNAQGYANSHRHYVHDDWAVIAAGTASPLTENSPRYELVTAGGGPSGFSTSRLVQ